MERDASQIWLVMTPDLVAIRTEAMWIYGVFAG
jgi:hypothetical protein